MDLLRDMETILRAFDLKRLQELAVLYRVIQKEGISMEEVLDYLDGLARKEVARRVLLHRKCPKCGSLLHSRRIVAEKGRGNVFGYKTHFYCSSDLCLFEEFKMESPEELVDNVAKEVEKNGSW